MIDEPEKQRDGFCVHFLICLALFIYGCGPNLLISTMAIFVRIIISFQTERKIRQLTDQIATLTEEEKRKVSKCESKLLKFDEMTTRIAYSIIPLVGPIVAYYKK